MALKSIAATGGAITTIVSGLSVPSALAKDATHLYWTEWESGVVRKVEIATGAVSTLAVAQQNPSTVQVDAESVYWMQYGDELSPPLGALLKIPKD